MGRMSCARMRVGEAASWRGSSVISKDNSNVCLGSSSLSPRGRRYDYYEMAYVYNQTNTRVFPAEVSARQLL